MGIFMRKFILKLLVSSFLLATPTLAEMHHQHDHHHHHAGDEKCPHHETHQNITIGNLQISGAYIRPTSAATLPTAAYITINNTGNIADRLIAVQTNIANISEIHNSTINTQGVMSMQKLENGLVLPARTITKLAPRGLHIMLMQTTQSITENTQVPIKLIFEKSGAKIVNFMAKTNIHQCKH